MVERIVAECDRCRQSHSKCTTDNVCCENFRFFQTNTCERWMLSTVRFVCRISINISSLRRDAEVLFIRPASRGSVWELAKSPVTFWASNSCNDTSYCTTCPENTSALLERSIKIKWKSIEGHNLPVYASCGKLMKFICLFDEKKTSENMTWNSLNKPKTKRTERKCRNRTDYNLCNSLNRQQANRKDVSMTIHFRI